MDFMQKDKYILLGLNIAHYRKLQGFTQEQLAEQIGRERLTIGRLETGSVGASLDTIFRISDVLGIDAYKLFVFRD